MPYILHVSTNDTTNYKASGIIKKTLQVKEFIKLHCKTIISKQRKIHDNNKMSRVIKEVIVQLQQLSTDIIGN